MDFLHRWAVVLGHIFRQIVSIRVMTLINTNVGASRHIKRAEVLLPVAVRHSKTPELNLNFIRGQRKRHAFRLMLSFWVKRVFWREFSVWNIRKSTFRKLQISIWPPTDFHFSKFRFPFWKSRDSHFTK